MAFLYRTAVIVSRRQPYVDWANSVNHGDDPPFSSELQSAKTIYLGPASDLVPSLKEALDEIWKDIFEEELYAWSTDENEWPADRSKAMFDAWFSTELADSIVDLVPDDPLTDEEMDAADVEEALRECGWCRTELYIDQGRSVPFDADPVLLSNREGSVLMLQVERSSSCPASLQLSRTMT